MTMRSDCERGVTKGESEGRREGGTEGGEQQLGGAGGEGKI